MKQRLYTGVGLVVFFSVLYHLPILFQLVLGVTFLLSALETVREEGKRFNRWAMVIWVEMAMACLMVATIPKNETVGFIMILVATNDVVAYIGGRWLNPRPELRPWFSRNISPSKTWAGYVWGMLATLGVAYALSIYGFGFAETTHALKIAAVVSLAAGAGDLLGSKWKRSVGLKDSGEGIGGGKLLPGHGGLADRFGALAMAIIVCKFSGL